MQPSFPDLTPACLSRLISSCSSLKTNPFLTTVSTSPWILEYIMLSHTCAPLQRLSLPCAFYLASSCTSLKFQLKSSILGSLPAAATTHPHPDLNEWSILSAATELADSCVTELPHCIVIVYILDNVWASWGQTSCFIHLCIPFTSSLANTWCIFGGWPAGWLAGLMNEWMDE